MQNLPLNTVAVVFGTSVAAVPRSIENKLQFAKHEQNTILCEKTEIGGTPTFAGSHSSMPEHERAQL